MRTRKKIAPTAGGSLGLALAAAVGSAAMATAAQAGEITWSSQPGGVTQNLLGIDVLSDSFGVAVGNDATVLKYDGASWAPFAGASEPWVSEGEGDSDLFAVTVVSEGDVWTGSYNELRGVSHWDGAAWSAVDRGGPNGDRIAALWSASPALVVSGRTSARLTRYDGTAWTRVYNNDAGTGGVFFALDGSGPDNIWAAATAGLVLRSTDGGTTWTPQATAAGLENAGWQGLAVLNNSAVWLVGAGGKIAFWDGASLKAQDSGVLVDLEDVVARAADDVYAVGAGGTVLHFDGAAWSVVDLGFSVTEHLFAIDASPSGNLWIVGENGRILLGQVPEPATGALLLIPAALVLRRRRVEMRGA